LSYVKEKLWVEKEKRFFREKGKSERGPVFICREKAQPAIVEKSLSNTREKKDYCNLVPVGGGRK